MAQSRWFGASVLCAGVIVLACNFAAVGQQNNRQPTRQIQIQTDGAAGRQQLRTIRGRNQASTPTIDMQTGTFQLKRQLLTRPPQRTLRRAVARWRIGVWTDNSPKGLRIREVSRYSPGWRFGIEAGDYLLDIMGYPVGLYDGAYYPLTETLNEVTPDDGWVNILIWNKRTGAEETMWIQAEPRGGYGAYSGDGSSE